MPEPSPAPAVEASGPSREQALAVGRKLNLARMVRAVNPATSARDLLVPWDDLEAIEGGDFGRVAGKVRLAVLIRAYGNYLGLDGNELAGPWRAEIDRLAPPPEPGRGLRVPMVIISPYAKAAYTDSHPASFNSVLAFIEHTFGLPPMNAQDRRAYDYSHSFDYAQAPLAPVRMVRERIPAWEQRYLAAHPGDPDDT